MTGDPEIEHHSGRARTADTDRLLATLAAHRSGLRDLARTYCARDIHVFGSVARGDAGPHSDIDLLASFTGPDYEQLMAALGFAEQLTELLGVAVDVVARELSVDFVPGPTIALEM
ncbi:nucleotidyltransferase family protein [Rhodococcus qingshengii]|uniref:nucleotidyltransferase family protein n=1 Tax=Rhodococcus qingshengii TaxID=334542 RepID=UPI0021B0E21A|nr:nucleotidyltransferase domain-containing protein [Rhodococcus qingshengii]MCT6735469.1 nucleotidyltransferase domain-containing protein [Rhodococcus qingshengii]